LSKPCSQKLKNFNQPGFLKPYYNFISSVASASNAKRPFIGRERAHILAMANHQIVFVDNRDRHPEFYSPYSLLV